MKTQNSTATSSSPKTVEARVGSYARKSDQNDFGIEAQHELNSARAKNDGFEIPDDCSVRFDDDNTTGVSTSRKGLGRLMQIVESGEAPFTRLYVKDKTRLGRFDDPRYHHYLEVHFERFGVTICYWENENDQAALADPANPNRYGDYLKDAVGSIVAAEERRRLISRVTGGMRDRVLKGFYPGALPPYGTEKWLADRETSNLIEVVPPGTRLRRAGCFFRLAWKQDATRLVIQRIFHELETGRSLRAIAHGLNDDEVPSPGQGASARWGLESVRRIARNPVYCGDLVWGRTTRLDSGAVHVAQSTADGRPAILHPKFVVGQAPVTRAQWGAAQAVLDGNINAAASRRASSPEYVLSGLVYCGHCGAGFHGHSGRLQGGARYYRHDPRRGGGRDACLHENRYVPAEVLEDAAIQQLREVLRDDGLVNAVREELKLRRQVARSGRREKQIQELERQLLRHQAALDSAVNDKLYARNAAERASYDANVKRIAGEVETYRRNVAEAKREGELLARAESRLGELRRWTPSTLEAALEAAPEERKRALRMILDRVLVRPERREIELRIRPTAA